MAIYVDDIGGGQINEQVLKAYIDSQVKGLVDNAPTSLDTIKELSSALNNDPAFAATVVAALQDKLSTSGGAVTGPIVLPSNPTQPLQAATKNYVDIAIANLPTPAMTLSGLRDVTVTNAVTGQVLAFNGTNWYPTNAPSAVNINNAAVNGSGRLIITLSNGSVVDAGYVVGAQGPAGAVGATGAQGPAGSQGPQGLQGPAGAPGATGAQGLQGLQGATGPAGAQGAAGASGAQGVSVTGATINGSGRLILSLSNNTTIDAGSAVGPAGATGAQGIPGVAGAQGIQGATGVGISTATVNGSGHLILTKTDNTTIDAGSTVGPAGPQGAQGIQGIQGPAGAAGIAPHNITLTGKVTGLATFNSSGDVTVTTALSGATTTDVSEGTNQYFTQARARGALSAGTGLSYNSGTGVISLNANTDQVPEGASNLYYTNNRFDNRLAQSNLMALADVANVAPVAGQALVWNGNTWAPASVATGGGGSSAGLYKATVRVEYDASGNLTGTSILDGNISAVIATATSTLSTVTFTFTGSKSAPLGIQVYGWQVANSAYITRSIGTDVPSRLMPGATAFTNFDPATNTMTLSLRKTDTGASAPIGQTTHCVVQFLLSAV